MNKKYQGSFIQFHSNKQNNFLREVKTKSNFTWKQIAKYCNVSRSMIFQYLSEKSPLPESVFFKLSKIGKIKELPKTKKFMYATKGIAKIPNSTSIELAEFIGIILGDGNINKSNHQITISGGVIDGTYISKYIPNLIYKLFNKKVSFRKQSNGGIDVRFSSKEVVAYIKTQFQIKFPKSNNEIPAEFFKDKLLLQACVKGLIDTDGGLHKHHQHSAQIHFTNKSLSLITSLQKALIKLDYRPSNITINNKQKQTYTLYLFSKDVKKYFKEIRSNNPKNTYKFNLWQKGYSIPNNSKLPKKIYLSKKSQEKLLSKKLNSIKIMGFGAKKRKLRDLS